MIFGSQAVVREFRERGRLAAGGKVRAERVWSLIARLARTQQAERHKIGQFPARRAGGKAQPSKDSLVYVVTGAGEGYGGYLGAGQARDVHVLTQPGGWFTVEGSIRPARGAVLAPCKRHK
jgi:hypothetical protein